MSSSFDITQRALTTLKERVGDDEQAKLLIHYIKEAVDRWHDASHQHDDELSRRAYRPAQALLVVLRHTDPEERDMWLRVKEL